MPQEFEQLSTVGGYICVVYVYIYIHYGYAKNNQQLELLMIAGQLNYTQLLYP